MPSTKAEVNVSVHNVNKLNESYEAVTVTPEGRNIGVNIPIDKFYDAIESGKTYDEVVDKAVDVVTNGISRRISAPAGYAINLLKIGALQFTNIGRII